MNIQGLPQDPTSEQAALNLIRERFQYSQNTFIKLRTKVGSYYDLYRGNFKAGFDRYRNFVHLPLIFSTIQSDVARKLDTMLGIWPYIQHMGFGQEDSASARKNDILISTQMKDANTYLKSYDFLLGADLYGTSTSQSGWKFEEKTLQARTQAGTPITRQLVDAIRTEKVITFDGPDWRVLDILDTFPQPGVVDIEEMGWFITRYWLDFDDVRLLEKHEIFDTGTTRAIELKHQLERLRADADERFTYRRLPFELTGQTREFEPYNRRVEVIEMWADVDDEFIPDDGGKARVMTMINRNVLARNRPNPFWHGRLPFENYSPFRDIHTYFGMGKVEVSEKLQVTANKLASQKLDALDLFIAPMFVYNRHAGIDRRELRTKPGGMIGADVPPTEAIQALFPDIRGLQNADVEIGNAWRWVQQATGQIDDTVMGGTSVTKRQTAAEFQGRQASISMRALLETRLAEEMWFEPLAKKFRALDRQFLPMPKELRMLGSNAVVDPITGEPIPRVEIGIDDLYNDYDVRAMGSTQVMGKLEKRQNMMGLLQSVSSNPAGLAMVNWSAFFREMFQSFDIRNTEELLSPPMQQGQQMAPFLGGSGSASPEAGGIQGLQAETGGTTPATPEF